MSKQSDKFIFDLWRASAYYDFNRSFCVPHTFYVVSPQRIDWVFTSSSNGKFLKKKQMNATSESVAEFFNETAKTRGFPEPEEGSFIGTIAQQYLTTDSIAYFQTLDLATVYDILTDNSSNESNPQILQLLLPTDPKGYNNISTGTANNKLATSENSNFLITWQRCGGVNISVQQYQKQNQNLDLNSYQFQACFQISRELKESLTLTCEHIVNSLNLLYPEQGKLQKIQIYAQKMGKQIYVLACTSQQFDKDRYLQTQLSYELKLHYPNEAIHLKHGLAKASLQVQMIEKAKRTQQCPSCSRYSDCLRSVTQESILSVTMRKNLRELQFSRDNQQEIKKNIPRGNLGQITAKSAASAAGIVKVCEECAILIETKKLAVSKKENIATENRRSEKSVLEGKHSSRHSLHEIQLSDRNLLVSAKQQRNNNQGVSCALKSLKSYDFSTDLSEQPYTKSTYDRFTISHTSNPISVRSERSKSLVCPPLISEIKTPTIQQIQKEEEVELLQQNNVKEEVPKKERKLNDICVDIQEIQIKNPQLSLPQASTQSEQPQASLAAVTSINVPISVGSNAPAARVAGGKISMKFALSSMKKDIKKQQQLLQSNPTEEETKHTQISENTAIQNLVSIEN